MYKCTDRLRPAEVSHVLREHWQVELDHVDTKIEKQNRCTYLEGGVTPHGPFSSELHWSSHLLGLRRVLGTHPCSL